MAKIEHFTGIDISKATFNVSYEEKGKVRSKQYAYTPEGMASFVKALPSDTRCVMESTGTYHCRPAYHLYAAGIRLSVVNPLSVKRYAQALMLRAKTDKADSLLLKHYGEQMQPQDRRPKEDAYIEMQQLVKLLEELEGRHGRQKNRLEALRHSVVQSEFVRERTEAGIEHTEEEIKAVEKEMIRFVKEHEQEAFDSLTSIPGIGPKTAIVLIALSGSMKNFDSAKELSSYFGLCPRIIASGTSVKGKSKICKMGMGLIRKLLYLCALSAKRCNRACRELYERLLAQGKKKKLALIAVANKLLKQAFSIVKNRMKYVDDLRAVKKQHLNIL